MIQTLLSEAHRGGSECYNLYTRLNSFTYLLKSKLSASKSKLNSGILISTTFETRVNTKKNRSDMRSRFFDTLGVGWPLLGRLRFMPNFSRFFCGTFEAYFFERFHQKNLGIFTAWFLGGFWPEIIGDFYSMMFRGIPPRENWGFLQHDF